jgi:hypothetical protein
MMNDDLEPFEQRLAQQPLKQIPGGWRAEILRASHLAAGQKNRLAGATSLAEENWLSTLNQKLSTLLWPHPKAWAGLAAVWVFILFLNFSTRDQTPVTAQKVSPPSPEGVAELKKQRRLFAELIGTPPSQDADRPKNFVPRPRSEQLKLMMG